MKLFGIGEAKHYCSSFGGSLGAAQGSIGTFQTSHLGRARAAMREGTALFQEYRDCSLRDAERSLFLAASHYRRCLDLMLPSSSPWALVTLYYGSWYASHALLAMFGCTIFNKAVVDVGKGSPGRQELRLRRIGNGPGQQPTTYSGSHQRFWDLFYQGVSTLLPMISARFAAALSPVSGDPVWQIRQRNDVNYDTFVGLGLAQDFDRSFSAEGFPSCLPGALSTQFGILEGLLELAYSYARQFGLRTDALGNLGRPGLLRDKVRALIYNERSPGLVRRTRKSVVT